MSRFWLRETGMMDAVGWRCDAAGCGAETFDGTYARRWSLAILDDGRDRHMCPTHAPAWDEHVASWREWQAAREAHVAAAIARAEAEYDAANPAPAEPFALRGEE